MKTVTRPQVRMTRPLGGRENFHIKRTGCSYVLVVKKVVLVSLMVFGLIKCTAGAFAPGTFQDIELTKYDVR